MAAFDPLLANGMGVNGMGMNGLSRAGMGLDDYTIRSSIARNLSTGNMIVDAVLMTVMLTLINTVFSYLQKDSVVAFLSWLWNLIKPRKKEPEPEPEEEPVKPPQYNMVRIRMNTQQTTIQGSSVNSSPKEEFIAENEHIFQAFYWYLNICSKSMTSADFAVRFPYKTDFMDQKMRTKKFVMRPIVPTDIDGFIISTERFRDSEDISTGPAPSAASDKDKEKDKDGKEKDSTKDKDGNIRNDSLLIRNISVGRDIHIKSLKSVSDIYAFIDKVWNTYVDEVYPAVDRSKEQVKWYFVRASAADTSYQRYSLMTRVTFDDVFFPRKKQLTRRIEQFQSGKTKFSRFSILLHGPPGGGKTSFIKALHDMTKCSIIVVKLSQFKNIGELISLFHSEAITLTGAEVNSVKVPINKRIFLFEDVDAEDKIVLKRNEEPADKKGVANPAKPGTNNASTTTSNSNANSNASATTTTAVTATKDHTSSSSAEEEGEESSKGGGDKKGGKKSAKGKMSKNAQKPVKGKKAPKGRKGKSKDGEQVPGEDEDDDEEGSGSDPEFDSDEDDGFDSDAELADYNVRGGIQAKALKKLIRRQRRYYRRRVYHDSIGSDYEGAYDYRRWVPPTVSINLADILNLLDGVLELNGCFLVLTTNHVDKLDPALIRDGRITYKVELGSITTDDMKNMIYKFFSDQYELGAGHTELDEALSKMPSVMPCTFEQLVQHELCLEDVITNIRRYTDANLLPSSAAAPNAASHCSNGPVLPPNTSFSADGVPRALRGAGPFHTLM